MAISTAIRARMAIGRGYGAASLSFRCNVDYNGAVTGVRVRPIDAYRG